MESVIVQVLIQGGIPGVMLWWFMQRAESRMDRIERALDRQTKGNMIALISRPDVPEPAKKQARELLAEIPPQQVTQGVAA